MADILTVPLEGRVPGGANIEILRAEMRAEMVSAFALIRYSDRGQEPKYGIRLDLDKKVFIDHLPDAQQERVMQEAAPELANLLNGFRRDVYHSRYKPSAQTIRAADAYIKSDGEQTLNGAQKGVIEVATTEEMPIAAEKAHVVEEVVVGKAATERVETVHDTVRRTDAEVEQIAGYTAATTVRS